MNEQHQWQFQAQTIPARLCFLLQQGTITSTDLLLSFIIASLVKCQAQQAGLGCSASNAYLGKSVGVCPSYVSERLQYLQRLGLVVICQVGTQRYIEMEWSRTAEERQAMSGEYGKAHRKAYRQMMFNLDSRRDSTKAEGASGKVEAPPSTKVEAIYKEDYERGEAGRNTASSPLKEVISNTSCFPADPKWKSSAKKLKESLQAKGRLCRGCDGPASANALRLLLEKDGQDFWPAFDWYCGHCSLEDEVKYNLPSIENGEQFRKRYNWISKEYRKAKGRTRRVYSHTINVPLGNGLTRPQAVYIDEPIDSRREE